MCKSTTLNRSDRNIHVTSEEIIFSFFLLSFFSLFIFLHFFFTRNFPPMSATSHTMDYTMTAVDERAHESRQWGQWIGNAEPWTRSCSLLRPCIEIPFEEKKSPAIKLEDVAMEFESPPPPPVQPPTTLFTYVFGSKSCLFTVPPPPPPLSPTKPLTLLERQFVTPPRRHLPGRVTGKRQRAAQKAKPSRQLRSDFDAIATKPMLCVSDETVAQWLQNRDL